jgi:hypothetical protein
MVTSFFRFLKIDKQHHPSCFSPLFSDSVWFTSTSPGKSLQHVSSKNASTGKLRALLHEVDNRIFSFPADDGQVAQIDYQFASFQITHCTSASGTKLSYPRVAELSLHHQPPLGLCVDDGNPEHIGSRSNQKSATRLPNPQTRKMLKSLTKGESFDPLCHRMSKSQLTLVESADKKWGPT